MKSPSEKKRCCQHHVLTNKFPKMIEPLVKMAGSGCSSSNQRNNCSRQQWMFSLSFIDNYLLRSSLGFAETHPPLAEIMSTVEVPGRKGREPGDGGLSQQKGIAHRSSRRDMRIMVRSILSKGAISVRDSGFIGDKELKPCHLYSL
ncbi:hypothetical protein SADUNF_Sadunf16G0205400 [Salix dunnii]|uniref:Uncharacterized protein n=1 Tax=Salix dunnii TaxID=1413687 RepID=A0A835JAS1_9ROSI|nr:hypothetical protein SADUNF_Sadunf16G0205400 [Salix dunnii]